MKRYTMLFVPVLLATVAACGREEPGEVETVESVGTVAVSAVAAAETGSQVPARIEARETASLATRGSGTVESVLVDVGSSVRRGQVLVRLEGSGSGVRPGPGRGPGRDGPPHVRPAGQPRA